MGGVEGLNEVHLDLLWKGSFFFRINMRFQPQTRKTYKFYQQQWLFNSFSTEFLSLGMTRLNLCPYALHADPTVLHGLSFPMVKFEFSVSYISVSIFRTMTIERQLFFSGMIFNLPCLQGKGLNPEPTQKG